MGYERRTWVDNAAPALSAANLNAIETAIDDLKRDTNLYASDYGAAGSAQINAALADAPVGARIIVTENGSLTSLVNANEAGVVIEGANRNVTLTKAVNGETLNVKGAKAGLRNLTLDGNKAGGFTGGMLYYTGAAEGAFIEFCDVKNSPVYGVPIDTADHVRVEKCHFTGNTSTAIRVANGADGARILHNRVDTTGSAATADGINAFTTTAGQGLKDVHIIGNDILTGGTSAFGIEIGAFGGNRPKNLIVRGNNSRSSVANNGGISLVDVDTSIIADNVYDVNGTASNYAVEIVGALGCSITGNTANGGTTLATPIAVNRCSNNVISGNAIYGFSATGKGMTVYSDNLGITLDNAITGNTIVFPATGAVYGILVQSNNAAAEIARTLITGNNIRGNGVAGTIGVYILRSSGTLDRTLVGMNAITNVTTPVSEAGTPTNTLQSGTTWNVT